MLILLNTYFFYSNAFLTLGLQTRKYSFFRDKIFSASVILPLLSGGYIKGIRNTLCTFSTPSPSQSLLDLFLNGSPSSFTWKDKMEKDMSKHGKGKKKIPSRRHPNEIVPLSCPLGMRHKVRFTVIVTKRIMREGESKGEVNFFLFLFS